MADTSGSKHDRVQMIADLEGDNPKCLYPGCGITVPKERERHPFCSDRCERKAMTLQVGTDAQRHVQRMKQGPDPFYFQTRMVDGGLWPKTDHISKIRRRREAWEREF